MNISKLNADKNKSHEKFFSLKTYKYSIKALHDIVEIFLRQGLQKFYHFVSYIFLLNVWRFSLCASEWVRYDALFGSFYEQKVKKNMFLNVGKISVSLWAHHRGVDILEREILHYFSSFSVGRSYDSFMISPQSVRG